MRRIILGVLGIVLLIGAVGSCVDACSDEKAQEEAKKQNVEYVEAVNNGDFESAHKILNERYAAYIRKPWHSRVSNDYWTLARYIYKAEMQYLIRDNDESSNDRMLNDLLSLNEVGKKPNSATDCEGSEYSAYAEFISNYNQLCDEILKVAIFNNNQKIAKQVIELYREDCVEVEDEDEHDLRYKFSYDSKQKAEELYNKKFGN